MTLDKIIMLQGFTEDQANRIMDKYCENYKDELLMAYESVEYVISYKLHRNEDELYKMDIEELL